MNALKPRISKKNELLHEFTWIFLCNINLHVDCLMQHKFGVKFYSNSNPDLLLLTWIQVKFKINTDFPWIYWPEVNRKKSIFPPEFQLPKQNPSGRKVCAWKEERRRKNNDKFSGHYVRPCPHNVHAHALRSHQFTNQHDNTLFYLTSLCIVITFSLWQSKFILWRIWTTQFIFFYPTYPPAL